MRAGVTRSGLSYSVAGTGPPTLWLSGYMLAGSALQPYVSRFTDLYTCVLFDARGSGLTTAGSLPTTTGRMARDALEVLHDAGFASADVHGLSLGGMVAQELAIRAPHRVRTLVLGATTAGGAAATPASLATMWSTLRGAPSLVGGSGRVSWRGAFNQAWAASRHDAVTRLARVQAPTLVVHGVEDTLLPFVNAADLAKLIPGAELCPLPRSGHFYPWENPDGAADAVLSWLATRGDVPAGRPTPAYTLRDLVTAPARLARNELLPWRYAYRALRAR